MTAAIWGGLIGVGICGLMVWWLIRQGKKIQKADELSQNVIELKRESKAKNTYIKDVERISEEEKKLHEESRALFRRGATVDGVVSIINKARKNPKAPTHNPT